jgi:hypothetical protein
LIIWSLLAVEPEVEVQQFLVGQGQQVVAVLVVTDVLFWVKTPVAVERQNQL